MLVSDTHMERPPARPRAVLILVLVDVGLGQSKMILYSSQSTSVLILVLVDVGLGRSDN